MAPAILVHTPVHASWLNQIEINFSIVQRKVLTPNDFLFCGPARATAIGLPKRAFMNLQAPLLLLLPLAAAIAAIGFTPELQSAQSQTPHNSSPGCAVTVPNQSQPPVKNFGGTVSYSQDYKGPRDGPIKDSHGRRKVMDSTLARRNGGISA